MEREIDYLRSELKERYGFNNIIGKDHKMLEIYNLIQGISESSATVLIQGESGTGKELIAKAIHFNSTRSKRRFVVVNCAAVPEGLLESELFGHEKGAFTGAVKQREGKFELADGGTLFLDEIGSMGSGLQAKLLRVLERKEFERVGGTQTINVDIRIIAATNVQLETLTKRGEFREDLYHRLNVIPIYVPPLRDRIGDIPLLVDHFIAKFNKEENRKIKGISHEALGILSRYNWWGNVRELENVIRRSVIFAKNDILTPDNLPPKMREESEKEKLVNSFGEIKSLKELEKRHIFKILKESKWNVSMAAKALEMDRGTLRNRINKYGFIRE